MYNFFQKVFGKKAKKLVKKTWHSGIKTGKVDINLGKLFTKLTDYRQKGDYRDLYDFDEQTVRPLLNQVKEFLNVLEKIVIE